MKKSKSHSRTSTKSRSQLANPYYLPVEPPSNGFQSFNDFYPFYLGEHSHSTNRRLHLIGTMISATVLSLAIWFWNPFFALIAMTIGYGFAWVGHFFFEKNKPATFKYPFYSLMGDFKMLLEVGLGKRSF